MEQVSLNLERRTRAGKSAARQLRREGYVLGVVYGKEIDSLPIRIAHSSVAPFVKAYQQGHNALFNLVVTDNGEEVAKVPALIQEIQIEPLSGQPLNIDFHAVSLTEKITATVVVHLEGEPTGVRNEGGILEHMLWEVEVECLPTQIPDSLMVDVSELHMNDTIHVSSLVAPEGVTILDDPEAPVASVVPPAILKVEEEEVEEEELEEGLEEEGEEGEGKAEEEDLEE